MGFGDFSKKDHAAISSLGMEIAISEILGVGLGYWLDKKFGTLPCWLLVGAVLGCALGFYQVLRAVKNLDRQAEKKKDGHH